MEQLHWSDCISELAHRSAHVMFASNKNRLFACNKNRFSRNIVQKSMLVVKKKNVSTIIILVAHALINTHPPVRMPKMQIFQANFPINRASNKPRPMNIEKKNGPTVCRKVLNLLLAANLKSSASNESPS